MPFAVTQMLVSEAAFTVKIPVAARTTNASNSEYSVMSCPCSMIQKRRIKWRMENIVHFRHRGIKLSSILPASELCTIKNHGARMARVHIAAAE